MLRLHKGHDPERTLGPKCDGCQGWSDSLPVAGELRATVFLGPWPTGLDLVGLLFIRPYVPELHQVAPFVFQLYSSTVPTCR